MARFNRLQLVSWILVMLLPAALGLLVSCDSEPTTVGGAPVAEELSGTGAIDPEAAGAFLLGSVTNADLLPGRIEIWANNVAFDPEKGIVSFDVELVNRSTVVIPPPIWFVITSVLPPDISVVAPDGSTRDGFPFYDFSDALGDDNLFSPEERTAPVAMMFHTATARSFAIGFRIDIGPPAGEGVIGGTVFRDENRNGELDRCDRCMEFGIPGITVALEMPLSTGGYAMLLSRTDSLGRYHFGGLAAGTYKIFVAAPEDLWEVTSANPLLAILVEGPDGVVQSFLGANFGLFPLFVPVPEVLFGPVILGPGTRIGTDLDTTFVAPPSMLTVVFHYYLEVKPVPYIGMPPVYESAWARINGELVFAYPPAVVPDTVAFVPRIVQLRDDLVKIGDNAISLHTDGSENAALAWRVFRQP